MDVYGYPSYQYTQSDELANQMYAQQALATALPYNPDAPEAHIMPIPSGSPWNVRGVTWGTSSPPSLVQFTAQSLSKQSPVIHCKRKSLDVEPAIPAKQLITEEKMAAHLNGLHISSEYTPHALAHDEVMDVWMDTPSTSVGEKLKGHTIILSEELKKIKDEPLIPAALIERLEKPTMSLVVWKPRENIILGTLNEAKEDSSETEEDDPVRRNGVLVAEHPEINDVEM